MAAFDQLAHLAIKKRQQQRTNVGTVDIRVSHDNDPVVTQLVRIEILTANAAAQSGNQRTNLY